MQYINPFSTLDIPVESGEVDSRILKRAKKRLLTEFELQATTTIEVNGYEMDKNTILKTFKQLENKSLFEYHLFIAKHPLLLNFLEKGNIELFKNKEWYKSTLEKKEIDFIAFLRPYFSEQFNHKFAHYYKSNNLSSFAAMCRAGRYLPADYEGGCFRNTYRTAMDDAKKVIALAKGPYLREKMFRPFIQEKFITKMNILPDYFVDIRIKIGSALEEIALIMNNKYDKTKLARKILRQGLKFNTNEGTRYQLQYILDQLNGKPEDTWGYGKPTDNPRISIKSSMNGFGWVVILLFFIRLIGIIVNNNSSSTIDDYRLNFDEEFLREVTPQEDFISDKSLVYSLIEHHKKSGYTGMDNYSTVGLSSNKNPFFGIPSLSRFIANSPSNAVGNDDAFFQEIINESPWDVILIYENSLTTCAQYLKKGDDIKLKLKKNYAGLTAYAGEDWRRDFPLNTLYKGAFVTSHGIAHIKQSPIQNGSLNSKEGYLIHQVKIIQANNGNKIETSTSVSYGVD